MSKYWKVPYKHKGEDKTFVVQTKFPWEVKILAGQLLRIEGIEPEFTEGYFDIEELPNGEIET